MSKTQSSPWKGSARRRAQASARSHRMKGLEQVRALSHPLRLELLELFAVRPRTTKQAAEQMGESPTRLYHHVAALERAGLIRLRETRRNRGATEKYFEPAAQRFLTGAKASGLVRKAARRDRAAMGFVVFDQARNELVSALASSTNAASDPLLAIRGVLRMSRGAAGRLKSDRRSALKEPCAPARPYADPASRLPLEHDLLVFPAAAHHFCYRARQIRASGL
jgi:DNA-binding transcriptional ArsR family regulator